jgi:hypothetical protein
MLQRCVGLSKVIYGDLSLLEKRLPDDCRVIKTWSTHHDMQCAFLASQQEQIIVFRGSESWRDWVCDMLICQVRLHSNVYIHGGFFDQLYSNGTIDDIIQTVRSHRTRENPTIWVTGHSLGGALASLCGFELARLGYRIQVVTFGSPRVGNKAWQTAFNAQPTLRSLRVTTPRDPVSASPIINYYHVGSTLTISAPKTENLIEQHVVVQEAPPSRWKENIFTNFNPADHCCKRYEAYCRGLSLDRWTNN